MLIRDSARARLGGALLLAAAAAGCDLVEDSGPVGPQPAIPIPRPPDASITELSPAPTTPAAPEASPARSGKPVEQVPRIVEDLPATVELDAAHYGARLSPTSGLHTTLNPKLTYRMTEEGLYTLSSSTSPADVEKFRKKLASMVTHRRAKMAENLSEMMASPTSNEVLYAAEDASHRIKQLGILRGPAVSLGGRSGLWLFLLDDGNLYRPGSNEAIHLNPGKGEVRAVRFDASQSLLYVDETQRLEVAPLEPAHSYRLTIRIADGPPALVGVAVAGDSTVRVSGSAMQIRSQLVLPPGESFVQGATRIWLSIPTVGGDDLARAIVAIRRKEDARPSPATLVFRQAGRGHR